MTRFIGVISVLLVLLLAMGFAAANAGHRVTLDLGIITLYQVPVTLVAFSGLLVGMLVMFATGIHSDLKVRRILRDRLSEESGREQRWIDRSQRDLFAQEEETGSGASREEADSSPPGGVSAPSPGVSSEGHGPDPGEAPGPPRDLAPPEARE